MSKVKALHDVAKGLGDRNYMLKAGDEYAANDPIVLAYPDCFAPVESEDAPQPRRGRRSADG